MKIAIGLMLLFALGAVCAQEEAKITGKLSDGTPAEPAPKPELPSFDVRATKEVREGGQVTKLCRVVDPNFPLNAQVQQPEVELSDEQIAALQENQEDVIPAEFAMVSATVLDHGKTLVKWWHKEEPFEAWSNVNFNYLGGFHEFEARGKKYNFVMGLGNVNSASPAAAELDSPELPTLLEKGPVYMLVVGDAENDEAIAFMEALHDLYEAEENRLIEAHRLREAARKKKEKELAENPPEEEEDVVIHYWFGQ